MKLETAIEMSNCQECIGIAKILESPDEFGIYNGHIMNIKATIQLDIPCLCGAPANGLQSEKKR